MNNDLAIYPNCWNYDVSHDVLRCSLSQESSSVVAFLHCADNQCYVQITDITRYVGTGNEDQHRLYKCIHSQDRDINIRHVSTNVVLISSRSDRSLCDRIGYRADRAKWHPATYKYTATSKQRRRTSRTNVQSLEPVIPFYYSTH